MKITCDPPKRQACLDERGLDFEDAAQVFRGVVIEWLDGRFAYPETRFLTVGHPSGRMVVIAWTPTADGQRIISMRKANDREISRFGQRLEEG